MQELELVLNAIISLYDLVYPVLVHFHIIDIMFGFLFVFCGYRLLVPIFGESAEVVKPSKRGK